MLTNTAKALVPRPGGVGHWPLLTDSCMPEVAPQKSLVGSTQAVAKAGASWVSIADLGETVVALAPKSFPVAAVAS